MDGNLIRDYIPVKENATGKIGLLDLINNKFYTNNGTGEFIAGPETGETVSGWVEVEDIYSEINNSDKNFKFNRIWNKYEVINVNDPNTLLLIHGEDISDDSINKISITNNGVAISAEQAKIGTKSLYFNGSSQMTLNNLNLIPKNSDFTMEWWEYRTSSAADSAIFH